MQRPTPIKSERDTVSDASDNGTLTSPYWFCCFLLTQAHAELRRKCVRNNRAEEKFPVLWENCTNAGLLKTISNRTGDNSCSWKRLYATQEGEEHGAILSETVCEYICKFEAMCSFETYLRNILLIVSCTHHDMHLSTFLQ